MVDFRPLLTPLLEGSVPNGGHLIKMCSIARLNDEPCTILARTPKKVVQKGSQNGRFQGVPPWTRGGPTPPRSWDDHGRSMISGPGVVQNHRFLTISDDPESGHGGLCTKVHKGDGWDQHGMRNPMESGLTGP